MKSKSNERKAMKDRAMQSLLCLEFRSVVVPVLSYATKKPQVLDSGFILNKIKSFWNSLGNRNNKI